MNTYLMPSIEFGPAVVARLIEHIPESRWDERIDPSRFCPREVAAHLADWEPILLERVRTGVATPGASVDAFDEGKMAIEHRYSTTDPREQVRLFGERRHATAEFLRGLAEADWSKTVVHPERGVQSVDDMANLLLGHDLYHLEQLSGYLGEKSVATW